jgi:serine/threonine-protein kinase RsbW
MAETPNVCLSLPSRPENVLVVRQALTGVAECVGLDAVETNDLNTAVTEACNNVVLHAYDGAEGPLEVDVQALADGIAVLVRDHGRGLDPPLPDDERDEDARVGLGLPVIAALSRDVELRDRRGGGTEVRMEFAAAHTAELELTGDATAEPGATPRAEPSVAPGAEPSVAPGAEPRRELAGEVTLRLAPNALARAVLPRVLSALAARAYFSVDRISDVQIVADVLAAKSRDSLSASHLDVGVTVAPRNLELRLGPLHTGQGESLLSAAADGMAPVIERLTDEHHRVASSDSAETLELRLVERQR